MEEQELWTRANDLPGLRTQIQECLKHEAYYQSKKEGLNGFHRSMYRTRRQECEAAVAFLTIPKLRKQT